MILLLLYIVMACVLMWKTSSAFEVASNFLGRHLSEGVKGATINAIASSVPELLTTFFFLFYMQKEDGFSGGIGTTAGSAIFNSMIIPSAVIFMVVLTGRAAYITVSTKVFLRDGLSLLAAELFLIFLLSSSALHWYHGLWLMLIYLAYAAYTIGSMKRQTPSAEEVSDTVVAPKQPSLWHNLYASEPAVYSRGKAWQLLILSTLVMSAACLLLVYAIEQIGFKLDMPIMFLAVVLASAASSIPDTLISLRDARQGQYDDAIANALGSNIFDISFALGLPLMLYTLIYHPIAMPAELLAQSTELRLLLLLLTVGAFVIFISGQRIGWKKGLMLTVLYLFFLIYILGRSIEWAWTIQLSERLMQLWHVIWPL